MQTINANLHRALSDIGNVSAVHFLIPAMCPLRTLRSRQCVRCALYDPDIVSALRTQSLNVRTQCQFVIFKVCINCLH